MAVVWDWVSLPGNDLGRRLEGRAAVLHVDRTYSIFQEEEEDTSRSLAQRCELALRTENANGFETTSV